MIRYPTGDGYIDSYWITFPDMNHGSMWDYVDDLVDSPNDDDGAFQTRIGGGPAYFTFSAFDVPVGSTNIVVTVHYRAKDVWEGISNIRAALRVGGINYGNVDAGVDPVETVYTDYSYTFVTNPKTELSWTVDDVNGMGDNPLEWFGINVTDSYPDIIVTQCYCTVEYISSLIGKTGPFPVSFRL